MAKPIEKLPKAEPTSIAPDETNGDAAKTRKCEKL